MLGILYGLSSLLLRGTADVVESSRIREENNSFRINELNKFNSNDDFTGTYFSNDGLRDVFTNERVEYRKNEFGDSIIFSLKTKKDIRNVSQLKREYNLKKNIELAKKENKTVALKLHDFEANRLYYTLPKNKKYNEAFGVEDYNGAILECKCNKKNPNYVAGDRYLDLATNEEYVIRKFYDKKNKYKATHFYMNIKNGHLVRRTDNQLINDVNFPEDNYISVEDTDLFISEFNEKQDANKSLLDANEFFGLFWYNDNKTHFDCNIKEKNNNKKLYEMQHFEV